MRFLLLTVWDPTPATSGSRAVYWNVFRLFPRGEVTVFTEPLVTKDSKDGHGVMRFIRRKYVSPGWHKRLAKIEMLYSFLAWTAGAIALCAREKFDCVYAGQLYRVGAIAYVVRFLLGIPYVVFVFGEELSTMETPGIGAAIRRLVSYRPLRGAQQVIATSNFTLQAALKAGARRDRTIVTYWGVDSERFRPGLDAVDVLARHGLNGHKVILTVGRRTERKGQVQVIRALPRILKAVPGVKYLTIGKDLDTGETCRALTRELGLEGNVLFIGEVDETELPKYYNACDVFVMTNYETPAGHDTEGFGLVFLEANACGKPVVGGRAGGVPEAIVDGVTGFLVDATNVEEVAGALTRLLTDEKLARRLGANGRQRALEDFTWVRASVRVREAGLSAARARQNSGVRAP